MDVTEDELLQMLEEDQAGFRIPMSLGEPHAELDASQCPQKTPSLFPQHCFPQELSVSTGRKRGPNVILVRVIQDCPELVTEVEGVRGLCGRVPV